MFFCVFGMYHNKEAFLLQIAKQTDQYCVYRTRRLCTWQTGWEVNKLSKPFLICVSVYIYVIKSMSCHSTQLNNFSFVSCVLSVANGSISAPSQGKCFSVKSCPSGGAGLGLTPVAVYEIWMLRAPFQSALPRTTHVCLKTKRRFHDFVHRNQGSGVPCTSTSPGKHTTTNRK